ncbi:MAG: LysM peptidoglycan-binding domain-containing M23 family metallopeptidase [Deltaproteobacteria bacterium]|nr:LysM peptidoglycan-binding domain-containing M23 family metallopeptidase [Deltaproteobacteria bacterium]
MTTSKRTATLLAAVVLAAAVLTSCTPHRLRTGVYHTVGRGETLWRISYTYGVDMQDVAEYNNIKDVREIKTGQRLYIPGVKGLKKVEPLAPPPEPKVQPKIVVEKGRFIWPVKGKLLSGYGMRGESMHEGIDIGGERNTPIVASAAGKVVYSSDGMRGYGNVVIIEHKGGFFTVYSHNEKNLVDSGDQVKQGQKVALIGDSGRASAVHVHFEIRAGKKTRNPLFFLP